MPIRVVQFGLGPIGQACVKVMLKKIGLKLVGAIDIDHKKAGRDVGRVCGLKKTLGIEVRDDADAALAKWRPQVVVHTTGSFLERVENQFSVIIRSGANIVSSTEELFYPYQKNPKFCKRIDRLAHEHGVSLVGTGVNPGFAMDILPLCLTGVCTEVKAIKISRVGDASDRRLPFQQKIGAGLSLNEFEARLATGTFGHVGLLESAQLVAATLGWKIDSVREAIEPVMATRRIKTKYLTVQKGQVAGIHQTMRCKVGRSDRLTLDWQMNVGAKQPFDGVEVDGDPPLTMRIEGGIFGDTGTIGSLVNTIPKILHAEPGLRTMRDLPVPYAFL